MDSTKRCTKCGKSKSFGEFPTGHNRCKVCRDIYMAEWADRNREKININQRVYQTTVRGRANVLLNAALVRANKKNELFKLTGDHVFAGILSGYCCKTLFPFDLSLKRDGAYKINPYSPSIDKINPMGIYEPSNVQYVCTWYNLAKGQMTEADLITFCKRVTGLYT